MISNVSWGVQKIDKLDFRNNKKKRKLLKVYIYIFLAKKQKKIQRVCCYEEDTLYSLKVEVDVGANSNIIPISSSIKIKTLGKIFSFLTWLLLHGARATFFSSLPYDRKRKAVSGPKNRADSQGRMVPYFLLFLAVGTSNPLFCRLLYRSLARVLQPLSFRRDPVISSDNRT